MSNEEKLKIAVQALNDIIDPIARLRRNLSAEYILNGVYAIMLSENHLHLKELAKDALKEIGEGGEKEGR